MLGKVQRCRKPLAALLATLVVALVAPVASAMKLKTQNLTQLITSSEAIVSGTVKSVSDGIDAVGIPYTEVTLQVGSDARGQIEEGSEYTFRQFGLLRPRTMANGHQLLAVSPEGFPRWNEGEFVVAFMHEKAGRTGLQTTAGMAQGKFSVINGKLTNQFNNAGLFDNVEINQQLLSPEQQNMLTSPGAVDVVQFMDLVGRAVAEDWIGKGAMK
ncbi:hypothetical protein [Microbulbifer sediminum]|uniref:hypothetical protein n=1 Tax=Microbulbifer sediminum TaxID=2904250 RepID=UPI001F279B65|nr:hypothetical protein [Microbulbifer sediminum]